MCRMPFCKAFWIWKTPVTIPRLCPPPTSHPPSSCHNPEREGSVGTTVSSAHVSARGMGQEERQEGLTPPFFSGISLLPLGESREDVTSPTFLKHSGQSGPYPFGIWRPKARKDYLDVPRLLRAIAQTHSSLFLPHLPFLATPCHATLNSCPTTQTLIRRPSFWTLSLFWVFPGHEL